MQTNVGVTLGVSGINVNKKGWTQQQRQSIKMGSYQANPQNQAIEMIKAFEPR